VEDHVVRTFSSAEPSATPRLRVDFLGHATLLIQHGPLRILSDPWWTAPAYRGQWYPYPLPVPEQYDLRGLDAVYISHAHEDHLHRETLRAVLRQSPDVLALIPARYDTAMRDYLRRIGLRRIRELPSDRWLTLRKGSAEARLHLLTHLDDSLLSVVAGGQVVVNANDALHAARRDVLDEYCRVLRRRLPPIDYLFCGFGGASYFPNCIHAPDKDDAAVARARERFFLENFTRIATRLQPRFAFPFAAHFVLPDERTWWISESRLKMTAPATTVRQLAPALGARVYDLQPGDWVADGEVHATPLPTTPPAEARAAVLAHYGPPPARPPVSRAEVDQLAADIRARAAPRTQPGVTADLDALLRLWDAPETAIAVRIAGGELTVDVVSPPGPAPAADVDFATRTDLVRATMSSPFGRDLITIGYAADVRLRSAAALRTDAHERLLNLLAAPQPRWRAHLRADAARTVQFLLGDPSLRYAARRRLRRAPPPAPEPALYAMHDWASAAGD
jgi:hypothetical protein